MTSGFLCFGARGWGYNPGFHSSAEFSRLQWFLLCPALSPLSTKFPKVSMTKNLLMLFVEPEEVQQEVVLEYLLLLKTQKAKLRVNLISIFWPPCVFPISYLWVIIYIIIISHPCMHIVEIIIFCTIFCYKLGHKNEEQCPGFEFKEIITILFFCHVFFTRVLGSSFCCVLSSLMPAEQGQGMTIEWCTAEDWRLCQQDERVKNRGGWGFH